MSKILLFLPPYQGQPLGPPAGLLSLAAVLVASKHEVEVLDAAVVPEYLQVLEKKLGDTLCFGVSVLTGQMIAGAIEASRLVKSLRPGMPIIFGGWHPTLLPEQTLQECFVDIIVRNQGEMTMLEVVKRLETGSSLEDVRGCSFKAGSRIQHNPDRMNISLDSLPVPAYDLVDFDKYESISGQRKLPYASSVGCPYACSYCTDSVFYRRSFNARSAQRVVKDVTNLVKKLRIDEVALLDSNFLVDGRRASQIASGFSDSGLEFKWTFQTSTDLMSRLTDSDVVQLGNSGVTHIGFGLESGSERVLRSMKKHHQKLEDAFESARKCRKAGIRATFNLIFGFPGETELDRRQTFRAMSDIAKYDNVTVSANFFTPYPGISIWSKLQELGLREPSSLKDWIGMSLGEYELPWITCTDDRKIKQGISAFNLCNKITKLFWNSSMSAPKRCILGGIRKLLFARLKYNFLNLRLGKTMTGSGTTFARSS